MPQNFHLPQSFNGEVSLENSALLGTTEFFNDPILTSLIDQALLGNQQLKILSEEIQIANNEIQKRRVRTCRSSRSEAVPEWPNPASSRLKAHRNSTPHAEWHQLSAAAARFPGRRRHLVADRHLETIAQRTRRGRTAISRHHRRLELRHHAWSHRSPRTITA